MNICIQNTTVDKTRDWDNASISLRLKNAEAFRYWTVLDAAKRRNPYANKTDIHLELLGLSKPDLLSEQEIEFFRTGKKGESLSYAPFQVVELKAERLDDEKDNLNKRDNLSRRKS